MESKRSYADEPGPGFTLWVWELRYRDAVTWQTLVGCGPRARDISRNPKLTCLVLTPSARQASSPHFIVRARASRLAPAVLTISLCQHARPEAWAWARPCMSVQVTPCAASLPGCGLWAH